MDFSSGAGLAGNSDTIDNGALLWAIIDVRGVKGSQSGGQYIDMELTVDDTPGQPFARRKIWEMVGDPFHQGNSEAYRQMGMIAITRILEAGRGAGPNNKAAYNLTGYEQLNGLRVPIKVGVEKGTGGHADKNRVAEWLTPNPDSKTGHKLYNTLVSGVFSSTSPLTPPAANGFGSAAPAVASAPAAAGFGTPSPGFSQAPATGPAPAASQWGSPAAASAPDPSNSATSNGTDAVAQAAPTPSPSNPAAQPTWLAQANGGA